MPLSRHGVGLVEAVVAALLTAVLVIAALGSLAGLQRSANRFAGRSLSNQAVRGTVQLLRSELRDLAPSAGELVALGSTFLSYRAVRATGLACAEDGGRVHVVAASWSPLRQPAPGRDSLLLLAQVADTELVAAAGGASVAGFCPDGVASVALPYVAGPPDLAGATYPAPLLVTEVMEIRAYESGGEWWIGVRSVSAGETIQPAFGPMAIDGLRITALDSAGVPTVLPGRVSLLSFMVKSAAGDSLDLSLDYSRGVWR
jgi:hypothetical protein